MNANNISTLEEIRTSSTKPTHTENSACTQYIVNMVLVLGLRFDRNQIGLGDIGHIKKNYIYILCIRFYTLHLTKLFKHVKKKIFCWSLFTLLEIINLLNSKIIIYDYYYHNATEN